MRAIAVFVALSLPIVAAVACGTLETGATEPTREAGPAPDEGGPSRDAGDRADASDGGFVDAGTPMVEVLAPGGAKYWIDATEVTVRDFEQVRLGVPWPSTGAIDTVCPGKSSWRSGQGECTTVNAELDQPVNCVDWCAAKAYCEAVGKRLCGRIGGGTVPTGDGTNPSSDQWTRACRGPQNQPFPYGPTYAAGSCNADAADGGGVAPVGSFTKCEGGYPGLFDMVGNLNEWEDLCFPGVDGGFGGAGCWVRGGAWKNASSDATCDHGHAAIPGSAYDDVGFRCCRDDP